MPKKPGWLSNLIGTQPAEQPAPAQEATTETVIAQSPLSGRLIALDEIPDKVFAAGVMGPGVGFIPTIGELRAPFDGTVEAVFPTGHAIGLTSTAGLEVLMHIGIDTVDLGGKYFSTRVQKGDAVSAGDLLAEFQIDAIRAAGHSLRTPIVVLNADTWAVENTAPAREVKFGDTVLTATRATA